MKDIEQAITDILAKQKKQPDQFTTLTLDNTCKSTHVKGLGAFVNLKSLSLCSLGLTTLEGFPKLPKLEHLTLSDNRITGGLQHLVDAGLTSLRTLELANNRLSSAAELAPLQGLPSLRCLDVDACPLTQQPQHRAAVFAMLDELKYLDSVDKEGRERDGDEEEDEDDEDAGEEELDDGAGEEEFEDEEGDEFEEGEKEYAILAGDAVGEDEEGDYQDEGEDDEDEEGEDEEGEPAAGGTKRKREEEGGEEEGDE